MHLGLNSMNVFIVNAQCGETIPLSANQTSSNVSFTLPASINNTDVLVTNAGDKVAFVNFGAGSSTTATAPGTNGTKGAIPILPGSVYAFQKNTGNIKANTCAAICASGETTQLYFTSIQGS